MIFRSESYKWHSFPLWGGSIYNFSARKTKTHLIQIRVTTKVLSQNKLWIYIYTYKKFKETRKAYVTRKETYNAPSVHCATEGYSCFQASVNSVTLWDAVNSTQSPGNSSHHFCGLAGFPQLLKHSQSQHELQEGFQLSAVSGCLPKPAVS